MLRVHRTYVRASNFSLLVVTWHAVADISAFQNNLHISSLLLTHLFFNRCKKDIGYWILDIGYRISQDKTVRSIQKEEVDVLQCSRRNSPIQLYSDTSQCTVIVTRWQCIKHGTVWHGVIECGKLLYPVASTHT